DIVHHIYAVGDHVLKGNHDHHAKQCPVKRFVFGKESFFDSLHMLIPQIYFQKKRICRSNSFFFTSFLIYIYYSFYWGNCKKLPPGAVITVWSFAAPVCRPATLLSGTRNRRKGSENTAEKRPRLPQSRGWQ